MTKPSRKRIKRGNAMDLIRKGGIFMIVKVRKKGAKKRS